MAGFKAVISGNVVEIYEYERVPEIESRENNGGRHDGIKQLERMSEYVQTASYVARESIRRMALRNFNKDDCFITLTLAENITDHEVANKLFGIFRKKIKSNS